MKVVVSEQSRRGKDCCLCNSFLDLFGVTDKFGPIITFSLSHESVTCMGLGAELTSVRVRPGTASHTPNPGPVLHPGRAPHLKPHRCDPRVSWTRGASPGSKRRVIGNQV